MPALETDIESGKIQSESSSISGLELHGLNGSDDAKAWAAKTIQALAASPIEESLTKANPKDQIHGADLPLDNDLTKHTSSLQNTSLRFSPPRVKSEQKVIFKPSVNDPHGRSINAVRLSYQNIKPTHPGEIDRAFPLRNTYLKLSPNRVESAQEVIKKMLQASATARQNKESTHPRETDKNTNPTKPAFSRKDHRAATLPPIVEDPEEEIEKTQAADSKAQSHRPLITGDKPERSNSAPTTAREVEKATAQLKVSSHSNPKEDTKTAKFEISAIIRGAATAFLGTLSQMGKYLKQGLHFFNKADKELSKDINDKGSLKADERATEELRKMLTDDGRSDVDVGAVQNQNFLALIEGEPVTKPMLGVSVTTLTQGQDARKPFHRPGVTVNGEMPVRQPNPRKKRLGP